jgi:hypothetical protein
MEKRRNWFCKWGKLTFSFNVAITKPFVLTRCEMMALELLFFVSFFASSASLLVGCFFWQLIYKFRTPPEYNNSLKWLSMIAAIGMKLYRIASRQNNSRFSIRDGRGRRERIFRLFPLLFLSRVYYTIKNGVLSVSGEMQSRRYWFETCLED